MFEAYEVAVKLSLVNLVSPQILEISKQFERLNLQVTELQKTFGKLGGDLAPLKGINSVIGSSSRAFDKAALSAEAYERRLTSLHRVSGSFAGPAMVAAASGGARGGGAHGGNIHVGPGGVGLGSAGFAAGDMFWPLAATGAGMYGAHALFESAKELDTEKQRFRLFGMSGAQNREAFDFVDRMDIYGSSRIENMRGFREAQGIFRESGLSGSDALAGAKLAAPVLAKLNFLAGTLDEESAATMRTANQNMLRYVESSGGLKSAEAFNRIVDFGYKLNVSSGSTVDWAQLRQFKARAGAAGFNLTEDAMARLEPTIAESKGGAVGYGLGTALSRLTGAIRIPNQIAHELVDSGIWNQSMVEFNKNGGIKRFLGNPLGREKTDLLTTNPELFYERFIRPMYKQMGYDFAEVARQNVMVLGRTGGNNATLWENQLAAIHRSVDALKKVQGIEQAVKTAQVSLTGEQQEFGAAWKDFKTEWGTTALPFFSEILRTGATMLRMIGPNRERVGRHFATLSDTWFSPWSDDASSKVVTGTFNPSAVRGGRGHAATSEDDLTPVIVHSHLILDGREVASVVTKHMAKAAGRRQTGVSGVDYSQAQMPAGGTGFAGGF
jgi:hypothetical protein